jgi:hypothetical protein
MTHSTSLRVILSDGSTLLAIPSTVSSGLSNRPSEVEGLKGVEG